MFDSSAPGLERAAPSLHGKALSPATGISATKDSAPPTKVICTRRCAMDLGASQQRLTPALRLKGLKKNVV